MTKDLKYYMNLPYRLELIPDMDEGGYTALYPELPGCITCAETLEDVYAMAEDAKQTWIEAELEEGHDIPEPVPIGEYSGQAKIRMPKDLHRKLAAAAKRNGVSMNQYCVYLLSKNNALDNALNSVLNKAGV